MSRVARLGVLILLALASTGCAEAEVGNVSAAESEGISVSTRPATSADQELYAALAGFDPPPTDLVALAIAIQGLDPASIPLPRTQPAQIYRVGDRRSFWTHNITEFKFVRVEAELMLISEHGYFWQDISSPALNGSGQAATADDWAAAGESFDQSYERVRAAFGEEESPGLDGDRRLFVIHSDTIGDFGGYFGQGDLLPRQVDSHSNEGQYFFMSNTNSTGIASDYYKELLAHEFQHMIHKNVDPNEETWLNEGLGMLAQQLAGMRGDNFVPDYLANPDQSLWYWGSEHSDYGQAFTYLEYLYERLGQGFIRALVAEPTDGLGSIDKTLLAFDSSLSADDLYADALTAAYFNDASLAEGQYTYEVPTLPEMMPQYSFDSAGAAYIGTVQQYGGTDILTFTGRGQKELTFSGDQRVKLLPTDAHSGEHFWWSSRQDSSFSTLTRSVDLSRASSATLKYWAWYDIEEDWDYAYLLASTDSGEHWTVLPATSSRSTNPNGQNLGHGFSGRSGGGEQAAWIEEKADLSAFVGHKILLRFAMQNDLTVNEYGFAVDDLSIPAVGWSYNAESGAGSWQSDGFVLTHNYEPQVWRVRAVEQRRDGTIVVRDVDVTNGAGRLSVDFRGVDRLVVFVIGQTRYTSIPASYYVELKPTGR